MVMVIGMVLTKLEMSRRIHSRLVASVWRTRAVAGFTIVTK